MPYTIGLLRSMPNLAAPRSQRLVPLEGRPPLLTRVPDGCPFAARCPIAVAACRTAEPPLIPVAPAPGDEGERLVACIRADEIKSGAIKRDEIFPRPAEITDEPIALTGGTALVLDDVHRTFPLYKGSVLRRRVGTVRAVDGVSFTVRSGTTLGLVGESGSGKTTTILEILELNGAEKGTIEVAGQNTSGLGKSARRKMRRDIQIVFQDPMASLDPRMTVGAIIAEPLTVLDVSKQEQRTRVETALDQVGLEASYADRYPHEFSGGQRQRIGIARALVVKPKILILDEPVSALDVSVQAGVINLLEDLKAQLGLSYLFVAHDLAVIRHTADDVAVMYLGRIVEYGDADAIFSNPKHPYTQALLSAVPVPDPIIERARKRVILEGDLPSPSDDIQGCNFRTRCPLYQMLPRDKQEMCETIDPRERMIDGRAVACHHAEQTELLTA
jgi:peptide/nickel transport system ATP-binding protein